MQKIVNLEEAIKISEQLRAENKHVVLVGGCFDVLHVGHVTFLEEAKKLGDVLFVMLESDETIRKIKGATRPINTQEDRANVLSSLKSVDFVIILPYLSTDKAYDDVLISIKPAIIATTKGDPGRSHKERQAALVDASVVDVIPVIANKSTTKLARLLAKEL